MKRLIKQIEEYEYISLDMFDTLIKRNVNNPKDIFTLMELNYPNKPFNPIHHFCEKRVLAEQKARELATNEEITFDAIYEQLTDIYNQEMVTDLKKLEIQMELDVCVANHAMVDLYNYCIKHNKKIYIISDMYLPKQILSEILHKNGFHRYENLYVSSEVGVQKASGNLFKHVLKDINIKNKQLIHIGDGKKGDFIQPRLLGIKSILIPNHINHLKYYYDKKLNEEDLFTYQTISSFINNSIETDKSEYWKIGYETLGPLLYGFSKWLISSMQEMEIKKVFFMSRDGLFMQKAFDLMNHTNIQSKYLYASRRALIVPLLWTHPELKDVLQSMNIEKQISAENLIKKLGLNVNHYISQMNKFGLERSTMLKRNSMLVNQNFVNFYEDIKNDVVHNSKKEYSLLLEYLDEIGFDGEIAIVDIGWHGNMQRSLCELIKIENKNIKLVGFYTGLHNRQSTSENDNRQMYGYLFQKANNMELLRREQSFNAIYETFFSAQHGSVEKYKKTGSGIIPVLYPYEYMEGNGSHSIEAQIVSEIQNGAIDFTYKFSNNQAFKDLVISPYSVMQNLLRLGIAPSKSHAELFGDFLFYDTNIDYIAKPKNLRHYIFRPQKFLIDFLNASWKIGFLRRFFRIGLPYYEIYMWMKKLLREKE